MGDNGYVMGAVVAVLAIAVFFYIFFWDIVSIVLNIALLYLIAMRVYYKYKQNDYFHYVVGLAAGAVLILLAGNLFPFWRITNAAVLGAIVAEIIYWFPRVKSQVAHKRRKSKRRSKKGKRK